MTAIENLTSSDVYHDQDRKTEAFLAYNVALDTLFIEVTEQIESQSIDAGCVLDTADQLQELLFEAIETGSIDKLEGVKRLADELAICEDKIRFSSYGHLADEFEKRRSQLLACMSSMIEKGV